MTSDDDGWTWSEVGLALLIALLACLMVLGCLVLGAALFAEGA